MPEPLTMDIRKCKFYLKDGAGSPTTLEVKVDEGTLQWTERKNMEYKKDRGILDHVREGEDEPMEVSIECRFNAIKSQSGNPITVSEFLKREGAGSALVSVAANPCSPFAITIEVHVNQDCGTTSDEIIKFEEFRHEEIGGDIRAGTLSIRGKCNRTKPVSVLSTFP